MLDKPPIFSPITNIRAFEEISLRIKEQIINGSLKPGDYLPSESALAHQFQVGRTSIREALRILELSGFISVHKGGAGGPQIINGVCSTIQNLFLDAFRLENITLDNITTARSEIEAMVLNHAINKADATDIEQLRANIIEAKKKIKNQILAVDENIQFHRLLARASKNPVYHLVMGTILTVLGELLSRLTPDMDASVNSVGYHERILDAILERDRQTATRLMEEHLMEIQMRLQGTIQK